MLKSILATLNLLSHLVFIQSNLDSLKKSFSKAIVLSKSRITVQLSKFSVQLSKTILIFSTSFSALISKAFIIQKYAQISTITETKI